MIRVRISRAAGGKIAAFQVRGHAGAGPSGSDIVCAAVSTLTQTAVIGLEEYVGIKPVVRLQEGMLDCRLESDYHWNRPETAAILETMVLGLRAVAREYPGRIVFTEEEV